MPVHGTRGLDPWAQLSLDLQRRLDHAYSRLTVATVVAEVRRDLTGPDGEPALETVAEVALHRLMERRSEEEARSRWTRTRRSL